MTQEQRIERHVPLDRDRRWSPLEFQRGDRTPLLSDVAGPTCALRKGICRRRAKASNCRLVSATPFTSWKESAKKATRGCWTPSHLLCFLPPRLMNSNMKCRYLRRLMRNHGICIESMNLRSLISRFLYPARVAVIPLGQTLLPGSSNLPGSRTERAAPPPLFGLAPHGVCPAGRITPAAVRSYRTFSPLPALSSGSGRYIFCGTFREIRFERTPPAVSRHAALWRPDFPPASTPCNRVRPATARLSRPSLIVANK